MTNDQIAEPVPPEFNKKPCKLHTTPGNVEFNLRLFADKTQPSAYNKSTINQMNRTPLACYEEID